MSHKRWIKETPLTYSPNISMSDISSKLDIYDGYTNLIPTTKNGQVKKRGIDKTGFQVQPDLKSHWLS
ncbi:hypothetical protein EDE11_1613, partial [Methylomonas methanica]